MRRLVLRAALVLASMLVLSALVWEVLVEDAWRSRGGLEPNPELSRALDDAFVLSTIVDVGLVAGASLLLVGPLYARLRRIHAAVRRVEAGETGVRVNLRGNDVLAWLGGAFDSMTSATEARLETQRSLMHAVSHELRTPIARLRFGVEQLATAPEPERPQLRREVDRDLQELDDLVDEILLLARVSPGGAERTPERFDLAAELRDLASSLRDLGPPVAVDGPGALEVEAEPRLVRRAVQNLLVNAQRHASSAVKLRIGAEGGMVEVTVEDDGPGIAPEIADRLFEPFVRHGPRHGASCGLGLAIARAIAHRHDGELRLLPRPATTFRLSLPRSPETSSESRGETARVDPS